jgi:DNA-directed RNA polymerase III subunit RPC6
LAINGADWLGRIAKLPNDSRMVLQQVEVAGRSGILKKTLQAKANLHENTVTKAIKDLVAKGLIKEFKTSKNTAKRMYVFHNLEPSEDSTGGVFYREGELDEGLVNTLSEFIVDWIQGRSWIEQKGPGKSKATEKHKKEHNTNPEFETDEAPLFRAPKFRGHDLVPHPANYEYPSAEDVLQYIEDAQVLKDIVLTPDDIDQLIQQLVYDDKIEEMSVGRYRSVRRVWQKEGQTEPSPAVRRVGPCDPDEDGYAPGNGLTQSPCGRCPVASDCRVGGIINPDSCVYMTNWLEQLTF